LQHNDIDWFNLNLLHFQMKLFTEKAHISVSHIQIDHKEAVVVPFRIPWLPYHKWNKVINLYEIKIYIGTK